MRFSARIPQHLEPNLLSTTLDVLRRQGRTFVDLTDSNPTRSDFDYPADLLAPLGDARGLRYAPEPLGLPAARRAVAAEFARRGRTVPADRIVLTASTSEAYSLLFKLLCNPGDEVLVPRPSYPLFEHLTRLESIEAVPYSLEHHGAWSIDMASVEHALSARTRALLIVSPNNPTGNLVSRAELDALASRCGRSEVAIVVDEVFADYGLVREPIGTAAHLAGRTDVLGFTLGGLSKSVGLPQVKLGWLAVSGPDASVSATLERLELVCDTYLSVSTPVQEAAADLLNRGAWVRQQIQARIRANLHALQSRAAHTKACQVLAPDAGWSAVLQVPALASEEALVLELLEKKGVLVHPGYFFDFAHEAFLVFSLLGPEATFADGVGRVLGYFDQMESWS